MYLFTEKEVSRGIELFLKKRRDEFAKDSPEWIALNSTLLTARVTAINGWVQSQGWMPLGQLHDK